MLQKMVSCDELEPGMVLARAVISEDGNHLLDENTSLKKEYIDSIRNWDIEFVWVRTTPAEEPLTPAAPPKKETTEVLIKKVEEKLEAKLVFPKRDRPAPNLKPSEYKQEVVKKAKKIGEEIHLQATMTAERILMNTFHRKDIGRKDVLKSVIRLMDETVSNREVFMNLTNIKTFDNYLLAHSVNSTVTAVVIGMALGFDREELLQLAECCLLHDIGMMLVPAAIWQKKDTLTDDEFFQVKKHTILGADYLQSIQNINIYADLAAYQHHERIDGSGYPAGARERRIHEYSQIIGLADMYTAMSSPRKYREKFMGYDAVKTILSSSGIYFSEYIVRAFASQVALYPIGSFVKLNTGEICIVVGSHPKYHIRPKLKVVKDSDGKNISGAVIIDLLDNREQYIIECVSEDDAGLDPLHVF